MSTIIISRISLKSNGGLLRACALVLLCPALLCAGTTGSLEGYVTEQETGVPLVGVNVLLVETGQGANTDEGGFFKIHNIRAGSYQVQISLIGYGTIRSAAIAVVPDRRSQFSVELAEHPIEMEATVVTHARPLIQIDVTGTAYEIDFADFIARPVDTIEDVVELQPGTTAEGNIRGGRVGEAIYLIDGLSVQDVIGGGVGTGLPLSGVSQMSVKTGGFDAEYGNALSGVVNVVTRTGGDEHLVSLRAAKDDLFGGTEVSRRNELDLALSGPVRRGALSYFSANNLVLTDTRWWQDLQHFFGSPMRREFNGLSKLDLLVSPSKRLTAEAVYSLQRWRDYEFSWRYNLDGLPKRSRDSYLTALLWTHSVSSKVFYSLSLSQFSLQSNIGQGPAEDMDLTPYQYDFYLLYITEGRRTWWANAAQDAYTLKADLTDQIHPAHVLKAGVELKLYDIESALRKLEPQTTYFGRPLVFAPLLNYSNDYHYRPRSGSVYFQDRIEAGDEGSVITLGLRYDFLDPRAARPAIELVPQGADEYGEQVAGFVPAEIKHHFSPRLGCSLPLSDKSLFFVNYGLYVQYPLFDYLYSGLSNVSVKDGVNALRGNPNLLAEKTRAWEISVRRELGWDLVGSLAYFNKETRDQVDTKTFVPSNSRIAGDYGFAGYVNNPFANARGFELVVGRNAGKGMRGNFSYAFMKAEGLSDYVDQGLNFAQWGFELLNSPFFLSWDQRHTVKVDVGVDLPGGVTADGVWQYHSGRPYTFFPSADGFTPDNPNRSFLPNNERMPANHLVNLKLARQMHLSDYELTLYLDSRNIFDAQNVRWMDSSGRVGGELGDPGAYYTPRRTVVGLRVEL